MKNKLKVIRAEKRLSQDGLAKASGISRTTLAMIENEKSIPDGKTIAALVKALNKPANEIFCDLDIEEKQDLPKEISTHDMNYEEKINIEDLLDEVAIVFYRRYEKSENERYLDVVKAVYFAQQMIRVDRLTGRMPIKLSFYKRYEGFPPLVRLLAEAKAAYRQEKKNGIFRNQNISIAEYLMSRGVRVSENEKTTSDEFNGDKKDLAVQEKVIDKKLESYIPILRGLISYHKRMMFGCESCCLYNPSKGVIDVCKEKCPKKDTGDIYLEALEESLRLLEKEIGVVIGN